MMNRGERGHTFVVQHDRTSISKYIDYLGKIDIVEERGVVIEEAGLGQGGGVVYRLFTRMVRRVCAKPLVSFANRRLRREH